MAIFGIGGSVAVLLGKIGLLMAAYSAMLGVVDVATTAKCQSQQCVEHALENNPRLQEAGKMASNAVGLVFGGAVLSCFRRR